MSQYQRRLTNQIAKLNELAKIFPDEKDQVVKYEKLFAKLIEEIQSCGVIPEDIDSMFAGLYRHLKVVKQRVVARYKFDKRDVDTYIELYQKNKKKIIPIYEDFDFSANNAAPASSITIQDLGKISFEMLCYTEEELAMFSFDIFKFLNIHPEFNIKEQTLKDLMREITFNYNIVSYHNYTHAFSVFQMFFALLQKTNLKDYLGNIEIFAGLISSLAHDMNHRGVNNAWHSKKKSIESQTYSDTSVMESMHIAYFFEMMKKKPHLSIVDSISDPNGRAYFKRLLVTNVLATDMMKHNRQVLKLGKRARATIDNKDKISDLEGPIKDVVFLPDRAEDKRFISNVIVHACDIGNSALPFDQYMLWAVLISQEFDTQYNKEAKHGLDVTGFLKFKDKKSFFDGQVFFIKSLVLPLWSNMKIIFSGIEEWTDNLEANINRLKEEKDKLIAAS